MTAENASFSRFGEKMVDIFQSHLLAFAIFAYTTDSPVRKNVG